MGKLKIGMIASPFFGIGVKDKYGGLEQVCYNTACGLARLGHKVVAFAPDESADIPDGYVYRTGPALDTVNVNWVEAEKEMWMKVKDYFPEFDIICSDNWFGFVYLSKAQNRELKVMHRHHGGMNLEWWNKSQPPFQLNLIAISNWMKQVYAQQGFNSQVCYNPVNLEDYPYHDEKGERYMFLGRIDNIKAPHKAIDACRKAGVGLDVVGASSFVQDQNYVQNIKNLCDGEQIRFIGEVNHKTKVEYLQNSRGLIVTSSFGEPFGLMSVEAFSCGTPVYALNDGALSEIVTEITGAISSNVEELSLSLKQEYNPIECRKRAEHFSLENHTRRYEQLIKQVVSNREW